MIFDVGGQCYESEELAGQRRGDGGPRFGRFGDLARRLGRRRGLCRRRRRGCAGSSDTGPARARNCARWSGPRVATPGRASRWSRIGMTISRTITRSWSKTRPSIVADTVPSIAFSSGTSPWSRVESATDARRSASESHATGVDVLHGGDGLVRERALGSEITDAQRCHHARLVRRSPGLTACESAKVV